MRKSQAGETARYSALHDREAESRPSPNRFDYAGRYYQINGMVCEPKPMQRPHPPILIGSAGEHTGLRIVAGHADQWNCPARTPEEFRHKKEVLIERCAAAGRDPGEIIRQVQILVRLDDAETARAQVKGYIEAGVTNIVLAPVPPYSHPPVAWLAREVSEPLAACRTSLPTVLPATRVGEDSTPD